jgi:hypothetical protein
MKIVKSIKTHIVTINPYNEVLSDFLMSEKDFNENGLLTVEVNYDEGGAIDSKRIFELDDNGTILVQMNYERQNDLIERTEFFDDDDAIQYRSEITTASGAKSIHEYHYNQLGNADKITIKNDDGEIEGYELFLFNENDQVREEIRLNQEHDIEFRKVLEYSDHKLLTAEKYFDRDLLIRTTAYEYNERNLVYRRTDFDHRTEGQTVNQYSYDLAGNQILDETFQNDKLTFKNYCLYDENNNLIEERVMTIGRENVIELIRHDVTYY